MITVPLIDWKPMTALPEDRKDGRDMLLWKVGSNYPSRAVVGYWGEVEIGHGAGGDGWIITDSEEGIDPAYWADINPPE